MPDPKVMDPTLFDLREDKTSKGEGFLGSLIRPDGGVMSEYTVGVPIHGKEMDIPTFVPTLTKDEVQLLLNAGPKTKIPFSIIQKAVAHAEDRLKSGKSVFAEHGEQQNLYPDLQRAVMKMPPVLGISTQPPRTQTLVDLLKERFGGQ